MSLDAASARVDRTRKLVASGDVRVDTMHIARTGVYLPDESHDRLSGQETIEQLLTLTEPFDLLAPLEGDRRMTGPDLVYPSEHTYISPWVMGGEPCVNETRIPTATVLALVELRGLPIDGVLALYPSLTEAGAEDAVALERRLSGIAVGAWTAVPHAAGRELPKPTRIRSVIGRSPHAADQPTRLRYPAGWAGNP